MMRAAFVLVGLASISVACGGAPAPVAPQPPAATIDGGAPPEPPPGTSLVRFDDLGLGFGVPAGFRVLGDDDLAARVRASASPRLQAALSGRASQKKALPLLTLSKDDLTVTLAVMLVPADASASELAAQQRAVMGENVEGFTVTDGPKDFGKDGVLGSELSARYVVRGARAQATTRFFVRAMPNGSGLAILETAVWPEASPRGADARAALDDIHFYAPAP